jgi:hypothetical protein
MIAAFPSSFRGNDQSDNAQTVHVDSDAKPDRRSRGVSYAANVNLGVARTEVKQREISNAHTAVRWYWLLVLSHVVRQTTDS